MKITGLTTNELREKITAELLSKKLLVDPIVIVRQLNFKVSVLGEVGRPSVVNVPSEKISLLEALGLAGDITIYGKKDNVMIIREENGQKTIKRINLNSSEIFTSDYYYLKSNDIVYVEANKAKVASSTRSSTLIPIILSALSFGAIIIDRIAR
jgi:polysaccharide export outer membrane protein